jgi:hypothetical protein
VRKGCGVGQRVHARDVEADGGVQRLQRIQTLGSAAERGGVGRCGIEEPAQPVGGDARLDRERCPCQARHGAGGHVRHRVVPGLTLGLGGGDGEHVQPAAALGLLARERLRRGGGERDTHGRRCLNARAVRLRHRRRPWWRPVG